MTGLPTTPGSFVLAWEIGPATFKEPLAAWLDRDGLWNVAMPGHLGVPRWVPPDAITRWVAAELVPLQRTEPAPEAVDEDAPGEPLQVFPTGTLRRPPEAAAQAVQAVGDALAGAGFDTVEAVTTPGTPPAVRVHAPGWTYPAVRAALTRCSIAVNSHPDDSTVTGVTTRYGVIVDVTADLTPATEEGATA